MNLENHDNINTILKYLLQCLAMVDKAYIVRSNFISSIHTADTLAIKLFALKHNLLTDEDFKEWIDEALCYMHDIKKDIRARISRMPQKELMILMNDESATFKFIEKYLTKEEELKNDRFFQCS